MVLFHLHESESEPQRGRGHRAVGGRQIRRASGHRIDFHPGGGWTQVTKTSESEPYRCVRRRVGEATQQGQEQRPMEQQPTAGLGNERPASASQSIVTVYPPGPSPALGMTCCESVEQNEMVSVQAGVRKGLHL